MNNINVCIIPSGDRSGQANLIHHYCKIGCNVFLPLHGTGSFDWSRIATWPALLTRSTKTPKKRNLEVHGFSRKGNTVIWGRTLWGDFFGEDRFIKEEENGPLYSDPSVTCEIIDFTRSTPRIDIFHTLRSPDALFKQAIKFQQKYFPGAAWITSTIFSDHHLADGRQFKNVCKMLPANYADMYQDLNHFDCYPSGFEFDLLNVPASSEKRSGYASFVHNFSRRYPEDHRLLAEVNSLLAKEGIYIPNYGGNISGQGADTKYSERGPNGKLQTLSIREAARLNTTLKAVIIFKQADYGGGAVWYALMAGTPIITHRQYVKATCAEKVLVHNVNTLIVSNAREAAEAVLMIENDHEQLKRLQNGMKEVFSDLVNDGYWKNFENFVSKSIGGS